MKKIKTLLAMLLAALMIIAAVGCTKIDVTEYTQPAETAKPAQSSTSTDSTGKTDAKTDTTQPADTQTEAAQPELTYAEGTVLRMATGYNNTKTGLFFDA